MTTQTTVKTLTLPEARELATQALAAGMFERCAMIADLMLKAVPDDLGAAVLKATAGERAGSSTPGEGLSDQAAMLIYGAARKSALAGRHKEATALFRQAIILCPARTFDWHFIGISLIFTDRLVEAFSALIRAVRLRRHDSPSLVAASDVLGLLGLWNKLIPVLRFALAVDPGNPGLAHISALGAFMREDFDEALRWNARNMVCGGNPTAALGCAADIRREQGLLEKSLDLSLTACEQAPERLDLLWGAALSAVWLGMASTTLPLNVAFAQKKREEAQAAAVAGDWSAEATALVAALTATPDDGQVESETKALLARWKKHLSEDDARPAAARNPDWMMIECLSAEAAFRPLAAGEPRWSGVPGLSPGRTAGRRRVWDATMFFNELDILRLRWGELSDVVDRFVIVESPWTHRGERKPLHYRDAREKFAEFADRVVHVVADERREGLPWDQESYQRNCIMQGLAEADDDDLVIVSDVDEIARAQVIRDICASPRMSSRFNVLSVTNYNYFLNFASVQPFVRPIVLPVGQLRRMGANYARCLTVRSGRQAVPVIHEAGWHFSWFGGVEAVLKKLGYFCHIELVDQVPTVSDLARRFAAGDFRVLQGPLDGRFVPIDDSFPAEIRRNVEHYRKLGWIWLPEGRN
jgi:hypothetical protein